MTIEQAFQHVYKHDPLPMDGLIKKLMALTNLPRKEISGWMKAVKKGEKPFPKLDG